MHTIETVEYEWDAEKAEADFRKHGVRFLHAATALRDEHAITRQDPDSNGEVRYVSIGMDGLPRVLVTVFTQRGDTVRIISSRKATPVERHLYSHHA